MATYTYGGREVSESTFKKKVYGSDSTAYKKAVAKETAKKDAISRAGSKGSSYSKVTRADGSVEVSNKNTGEVVSQQSVDQAKEANKNVVVVGVGKDSTGQVRTENVGKYLTEEQRREVSKLASDKGRLNTRSISETQVVNAQGQTVKSSSVTFEYAEKKDPVPVAPKNFIEDKKDPVPVERSNSFLYAPKSEGVPFQTTRTDMSDGVELGGLFVPDDTPKDKNLLYDVDDRSTYAKIKDTLAESIVIQGDSDSLTAKEVAYSVPIFAETVAKTAGQVVKGFVIGGLVGTVKAVTVDIDKTLTGVTDLVTGKTKVSQVADALTASLYADPAYVAGEITFAVSAPTIIGKTIDKVGVASAMASGKYAPVIVTESGEVISGVVRSGSVNARTIGVRASGVIDRTPASTFDIPVAGGVASTAESLVEQAKLAGQTVDAVSGQRSLFNVFKKEIEINKPKPTPDASPLEEMFFSDPRGRIRTSRLGLTPEDVSSELSFSELLSNPSKLFERPQIVVQEGVRIADFPVELQGVKAKLLTGQTLTAEESAKLLSFQQSVTGEFKPIGFLGRESEITLAKGEVLVKEGTSAVTVIEGKRVPIISTTIKPVDAVLSTDVVIASAGDVVTSSGSVVSSSSSSAGKVVSSSTFRPVQIGSTSAKIASSSSNIAGSSLVLSGGVSSLVFISTSSVSSGGSSSSVAPSYVVGSKIFSSSSIVASSSPVISSSGSSGSSSSKSSSGSVAPSSFVSSVSSVSSSFSSGGSSDPSPPPPSFSSGGSSSPPPPPPPYSAFYPSPYPKSFSSGGQKESNGFDVFVRTRGVFKKVSSRALSKGDARDLGAFNVSNTPQATFTLRPSSRPLGVGSSKARGSFNAFRSNFFQKGGLFIEKRGKRIKSGGEKAGITRLGILANKNKKFKGLKI